MEGVTIIEENLDLPFVPMKDDGYVGVSSRLPEAYSEIANKIQELEKDAFVYFSFHAKFVCKGEYMRDATLWHRDNLDGTNFDSLYMYFNSISPELIEEDLEMSEETNWALRRGISVNNKFHDFICSQRKTIIKPPEKSLIKIPGWMIHKAEPAMKDTNRVFIRAMVKHV